MGFDINICRSELIRLGELKTTLLNDINRINERKEVIDKWIFAISALLSCYATVDHSDGHSNHTHEIQDHDDFIELRVSTPERDAILAIEWPAQTERSIISLMICVFESHIRSFGN